MSDKCALCGKELLPDDLGCTRKLISRGASEFLCVSCLAGEFGTTEKALRAKIEYWRDSGCMLFPKKDKDA